MKIYHVTAFPYNEFGGNKAGVVYLADALNSVQKQTIAKRLNYSETAFVSTSDLASFKVQFFTPISEVDLCGHATIATFNTLRDLKVINPGIFTQETKAGILKLDVRDKDVFMEQNLPLYGEVLSSNIVANCFNEKDIFHPDLPIQVLSTGIREIFIPVKDIHTLNRLEPDFKIIKEVSNRYNAIGMHLFAFDEGDVYGRNFAPCVGIDEESATGTSNGALSCYLHKYESPLKLEYTLYQGFSMKRPSVIKSHLEVDEKNNITCVWVGGTAQILKTEFR